MFSRAARVPPVLVPCYRHIYQQRARLVTTAAADAKTPVPPSIKRTAYFRTWRIPANLTELYTVIREVEKKYGKIATYHLLKDFEDQTRYQLLSYIVFEDPESLQRIPENGIELTVPVNPTPKPYYDIGIDEVESTLFNNTPPSTSDTPADENGAPVFGFKLMRSPMEYKSERIPRGVIYQNTPYRSMEHFQNWAGFAKLDPLDPPRTIVERELFANRTEIDQNRMRAALQLCARHFIARKPPVQPRQEQTSIAQSASNEASSTSQSASNETTSTARSALNEVTSTRTAAHASPETVAPATKTTVSKTDKTSSQKSSSLPRSAAQLAADKATEQARKGVEGAKKESKDKASGETKSTESSKQKAVSTSTKLVIPPAVQMPAASQRKKDPKPKIKAAKNPKAKTKSKQEPTDESKPQPEPAAKSEPEPTKAKGPLEKLWSLFSRS